MPLYEYRCLKCEKVHEIIQKFSDAPLKKCPDCAGRMEKQVSMSSFALKGSGWYTTDYKRSSPGKASSGAAEKSETAGCAKPECGTGVCQGAVAAEKS